MIAHRKKMMPIIFRIRRRLRKRVTQYGGPLEERLRRRDVRGSNAALMAGCLRPVLRERAKSVQYTYISRSMVSLYSCHSTCWGQVLYVCMYVSVTKPQGL